MLNLKSLLILFLFSFSFQDQNCLITFKGCDLEPYKEIKINNCIEHYFENKIEKCYECKNGYAVSDDEKTCIEVKNRIDHCISYSKGLEDFYCTECENNYALYSDNKECVKFDHCSHADDKDHCDSCDEGYTLSNDKTSCKPFANCNLLDAAGTKCIKCSSKYYLNSNGQCEKTLCSEYSNNVCTGCHGGYYLNDKNECQKITIENCLILDSSKKKCSTCIAGIIPDTNGNCILPSKLIEGCYSYESNGDCRYCYYNYKLSSDKKNCEYVCTSGKSIEYCGICKPGYTLDKDDGICLGYDGSKDSSSNERHKVQYALLSIILLLLI